MTTLEMILLVNYLEKYTTKGKKKGGIENE